MLKQCFSIRENVLMHNYYRIDGWKLDTKIIIEYLSMYIIVNQEGIFAEQKGIPIFIKELQYDFDAARED